MRAILLRVIVVALLLTAVALTGARSTRSDDRARLLQSGEARSFDKKPSPSQARPLTYRSPGAHHKLMLRAADRALADRLIASRAARKFQRYPSHTLIEITDAALASLDSEALERAELRDDMNLVMLRRGQIDTTAAEPALPDRLRQPESLPYALHLVQFFGSPTPASLAALKATGARVISYIPNNTYLVWASRAGIARVRALKARSEAVQWDGTFHPAYKLDPRINLDSIEQVPVSIELVNSERAEEAVSRIEAISRETLMPKSILGDTIHIRVLAESFRLAELARIPEVLAVEPWVRFKMLDERAGQIVAGDLSEETINSVRVSRPAKPGFLPFLSSLGFDSDIEMVVDVADSGFDRGSSDPAALHPDFLDRAGLSRVAYLNDFTADFNFHRNDTGVLPAHDSLGHGTLNASIIGGFNDQAGSEYRDSLGFQYGLGIAPFVRIGASKVFNDNAEFTQVPIADIVQAAYRGGARVTSNSWGTCSLISGFCNLYTIDSRAYDLLVRDADFETPGNQGLITLFSAGNEGLDAPNSINMPGTAKNVITVGATEGFRATDDSGASVTDGCNVGPTRADNAADVVDFSSGGFVQDGRSKPDICAPGSHIVGAAPQDPFFVNRSNNELGVCDRFFPFNQTLYTWSSGTSHSTPIVAGGAALAFWWLKGELNAEPSPALVKAFMLNSTSYVTGRFGNDSLPGRRQGWGMMSLARMFEATDRVILDEDASRLFTQSGGAPFVITGVITDASKEFRAMLAYTDAAGAANSNAPYVNQLNLEVIVNGVSYSANNFQGQHSKPGGQKDFLNNTQGVRLPPGVTGSFVIRIWPTVIAGDGVPGNGIDLDQDFALVVTNGRQAPVPILNVVESEGVSQGVTITHDNGATDSSVRPGELVSMTIHVVNDSPTTAATAGEATLTQASGGASASSFPVIEPGRSSVNSAPFQMRIPSGLRCGSVLEFQLRLSTQFGQFTLPVRVRVGQAGASSTLLADDVDSRQVKWKAKKGFSIAASVGNSGTSSYHVVDSGRDGDGQQLSTLKLKKKITIPEGAGQVRLSFLHIFNFEPGFDGGVLEISTDGGLTWEDLGSRILVGGYDGHVTAASENPLGNRFAWTSRGRPGVFSQVVINLDDFAGKRIALRFLAGFDVATGINQGYAGWFIDDIRLTATSFLCR
jgi:hypothetical protein